jgi:septum formation protein
LLRQIGVEFTVLTSLDVDESTRAAESPAHYVGRIMQAKAAAARQWLRAQSPQDWVALTADTTVALGNIILGKPANIDEARDTLRLLSGRTHEVLTAIAVADTAQTRTAITVSRVTFRDLDAEDIRRYCETDEPYDKAGGYAIQGRAAAFVRRIEGSYSGIMGLPLCETVELLRGFQVVV